MYLWLSRWWCPFHFPPDIPKELIAYRSVEVSLDKPAKHSPQRFGFDRLRGVVARQVCAGAPLALIGVRARDINEGHLRRPGPNPIQQPSAQLVFNGLIIDDDQMQLGASERLPAFANVVASLNRPIVSSHLGREGEQRAVARKN